MRLLGGVCQRFAQRVMQCLRRQVRRERELPSVRSLAAGVLIVVRRFKSDLSLLVHLHALVTDGCYLARTDGEPEFFQVESLGEPTLLRVLSALHDDFGDDELSVPGSTGGEYSPRLISFVESVGNRGLWGSVCSPDSSDFFEQAVALIDTACEEFEPEG